MMYFEHIGYKNVLLRYRPSVSSKLFTSDRVRPSREWNNFTRKFRNELVF